MEKTIRMQITNWMIFAPTPKEIKTIAEEQMTVVFKDQRQLETMIRDVTIERPNFFHINLQQPNIYEMFTKNLDDVIIIDKD